MTPADIVISRFGGVRPVARLLSKDPSTIHRWKQPPDKGGLGGRVPSAVQGELLRLAQEHSVELNSDDLVMSSNGLAISALAAQESSAVDTSASIGAEK